MIEWFRHDTDARNDIKIRRLLRDNDRASLGAYWMCVEIIYQNEGYADEAAVTEELSFYNMDEFIPALIDLDLIERTGDGRLTSKRVLSEIAYWEQTRRKKVEAGRKGGLATQAKATIAKQNSSSAKAVLEDTKAPSSTRQDTTKHNKDSNSSSPLQEVSTKKIRDINSTGPTPIACSELLLQTPPSPSPAVICLTLIGGKQYEVTQEMVDIYQETFPAVDVVQELRKMKLWCDDRKNVNRRKTERGIQSFIRNWLSREQDRPSGRPERQGNGKGFVPTDLNGQYDDELDNFEVVKI